VTVSERLQARLVQPLVHLAFSRLALRTSPAADATRIAHLRRPTPQVRAPSITVNPRHTRRTRRLASQVLVRESGPYCHWIRAWQSTESETARSPPFRSRARRLKPYELTPVTIPFRAFSFFRERRPQPYFTARSRILGAQPWFYPPIFNLSFLKLMQRLSVIVSPLRHLRALDMERPQLIFLIAR